VAYVVSPASPNKKHFFAAGANAASSYGKFGAKLSNTSRAANLAKEGKIAVQILYRNKAFEFGAKFISVYIKFIRYQAGKIQFVYNFKNEFFKDAFTDILVKMRTVHALFEWLNFAIQEMKYRDS
jgi:hypothetical protein